MGFKSVRISDISGEELGEDAVTIVVRPDGKVLDAGADELTRLKTLDNLVTVELRFHESGETKEVFCTRAELNKLIPAKVLDAADSVRGRRTGYVPPKKPAEPKADDTPTEPEAKAS